ncbi:AmmeMemoRadiSam system protein B [Nanoarchaeota archaeon]
MRKPIVAGMFYEADPEQLKKQLKECFEHKLGPGDVPLRKQSGKIKALIVPHAGFIYSGPCAAWAYKELAESEMPNTFIILGTSHIGADTAVMMDDWETPLGKISCDKELVEAMVQSGITQNAKFFTQEHSIEVQLPWLQFIYQQNKEHLSKLKIVPMVIGDDNFETTAEKINKALKAINRKNVCFIVSTDFTHYGPNYGYVPFVYNIKESLYKMDKDAIEFITKTNPLGFLKYCKNNKSTICGKYPTALLLSLMEGEADVKLLNYYTSGDIVGDYENAVGYGAIVFR